MANMINCFDISGIPHPIPANEIVERISSYGLCIQNNQIILVRDENQGNMWGLPGGGLEKKESIEQNIKREFTEETGLKIEGPLEFITTTHEFFYSRGANQGWHSHRNYFLIKNTSGTLKTEINRLGTAEARWVNLADLNNYEFKPGIKDFIDSVIHDL